MIDYTAFLTEAGKFLVSSALGVTIGTLFAARQKKDLASAEVSSHECEYENNIERMFSAQTEIFNRLESLERDFRPVLVKIGEISVGIVELRHKFNWLESKTEITVTSSQTGKKFILLVDDRIENMMAIKELLEDAGYYVNTASSYQDGLDKLHAMPHDIAVIDACLTDNKEDGLELAEQATALYPDIKIIIYSGKEITRVPINAKFLKKSNFHDVIKMIKEMDK